jgi:hypothetical protein
MNYFAQQQCKGNVMYFHGSTRQFCIVHDDQQYKRNALLHFYGNNFAIFLLVTDT